MPRLLAVDGNSLGHRGFHSVGRDVTARSGAVTGAVVSMLASAWSHGPYDGLLVAFDHPENRRKLLYPEYKAQRPATPPELTAALGELRGHLMACGATVVEDEGFEADDLLAAAVDDCLVRGWPCDVLSSDRDLTALVEDGVRLLRPRATFADLVVEDVTAVRRRYGIEPQQYTELAALRGDPSDGLDGARGIGEKTAARLLAANGSVTALYERLHELPTRIESTLRRSRQQVERNLLLMAPLPHPGLDVGPALTEPLDPQRFTAVLDPLGLERAAARFRRAVTTPRPPLPPRPPPPADPDPDPVAGAVAARDGGARSRGADGTARRAAPDPGDPGGDNEQTALF